MSSFASAFTAEILAPLGLSVDNGDFRTLCAVIPHNLKSKGLDVNEETVLEELQRLRLMWPKMFGAVYRHTDEIAPARKKKLNSAGVMLNRSQRLRRLKEAPHKDGCALMANSAAACTCR